MAEQAFAERPFCADVSQAHAEPLAATASRVEHWLLVEYSGYWPHDPLDATVFAGSLRAHVAAQLERLPLSRLLLVRRPGRALREHVRVVYGSTPERGGRFYTLTLDRHPGLLGLDVAAALLGESEPVGEPLEHPLLLVCTHGKRDRCCAKWGFAVFKKIGADLSGRECLAVESSHLGGDRFAATAIVFPGGHMYGHLDASMDYEGLEWGPRVFDWIRYRGCVFETAEQQIVRAGLGARGIGDGTGDLKLIHLASSADVHEFLFELNGVTGSAWLGFQQFEFFGDCRTYEADRKSKSKRFVLKDLRLDGPA